MRCAQCEPVVMLREEVEESDEPCQDDLLGIKHAGLHHRFAGSLSGSVSLDALLEAVTVLPKSYELWKPGRIVAHKGEILAFHLKHTFVEEFEQRFYAP